MRTKETGRKAIGFEYPHGSNGWLNSREPKLCNQVSVRGAGCFVALCVHGMCKRQRVKVPLPAVQGKEKANGEVYPVRDMRQEAACSFWVYKQKLYMRQGTWVSLCGKMKPYTET